MSVTIVELRHKLRCSLGGRRTTEEWASRINMCILLALSEASVEQYGLVKFHVRRAQEVFQAVQIIHNRRLEGVTDMTIVLDEPKEEDLPLTWMDWFGKIQFDFMQGPMVDISNDTLGQLKGIIEHLGMIYHDLEEFQSNVKGLKTHLLGYIL